VAVSSGSPAAQAGVLVGDVLLALDGRRIESAEDL
jgi:S1-C subfamily serine protease